MATLGQQVAQRRILANQKRGLRSLGRDRHPNRSPIGSGVSDYYSERGGKNRSMLRNPFRKDINDITERERMKNFPFDLLRKDINDLTERERMKNTTTLPGGSPDQEFFDTYGVPMRGNVELDTGDGEKIYGLGDRLTRESMLIDNDLINYELAGPPMITGADGIPIGYENTQPSSLFGGEDMTTGDPAYGKQLDAFNDYNTYNTRQPGLDSPYEIPTGPRPIWDNPIGNFFRKLNPFNRGGIASLRR